MNIVLRNNLILITTDFETLNISWMQDFLNQHTRGMLFLPKSVLVFRNGSLTQARENFLQQLSAHHASTHDFSHDFFLRSMLKYGNKPIQIELNELQEQEVVKVKLYAYDKSTVLISLDSPNSWVINYLRSQLEVYVERGTDDTLVIDVSEYKAKARLERALNNNVQFYTILECPIGASQDALKKSYKKLTKVYHPDKVFHETPNMVEHYTHKFQLLQEAYTALRIVS